jgi:ABC-type glycerol-3-phosphate transport system substrate-binding protein
MKKINKILSLSMVALMGTSALGAFTACGGKEKKENEMVIEYYRSGMGITWLENLAKAFEDTHEGYKVTIEDSAEDVGKNLDAGEEIVTADLLIGSISWFLSYKDYIEPLDDILKKPVYNSTVTIEEKLDSNLMRTMTYDGKTYAVNWTSMPAGLFYNESLFESMNYKLPRTSKELADLAQTIVDDENQGNIKINGKEITNIYGEKIERFYPFIHYNKDGDYWKYVDWVWRAQYDGIDQYYASEQGGWIDENGEMIMPHINFAFTQGRYESMKALEACVAPDKYTYEYSNTIDHTTAQTHFLNGTAAMMANGGWLENEMRSTNILYDFNLMKTPVLSAVGEKLNITEAQLCEIVDYVDSADYKANTINDNSTEYNARVIQDVKALTTAHKDIYGKDMSGDMIFAEVYEDRNLIFNNGCGMRMVMPNYSTRKAQATEFLQFMFSDQGLKVITESTRTPAPAKFEDASIVDMSSWSKLSKNIYKSLEGKTNIINLYNVPFFLNNTFVTGPGHIVSYARQMTEVQSKSADQLWLEEYTTMSSRWEDALKMANIPVANGTLTLTYYPASRNPINNP